MGWIRKCIRCGKEFFQTDFDEDEEECGECQAKLLSPIPNKRVVVP